MRIDYGIAKVNDLQCVLQERKDKRPEVSSVLVAGRPCTPTARFWTSLQARFGFSKNIFKYFSHDEVFNRISEVAPNDRVRYCIEEDGDQSSLLAVTSPAAALIQHDELMALLNRQGTQEWSYDDGIVRSTHLGRNSNTFQIAGDDFARRFVCDTPIDGFGRPSVFLSLLRMICSNGMVAVAPAFRSEISLGKGESSGPYALERVLTGYSNEEGMVMLQQRIESAAKTWASVAETQRLYKQLARLHNGQAILGSDGAHEVTNEHSAILRSYQALTGDLAEVYGLANLDSLAIKRQQTLPAPCKVYDLVNFASEIATHHAQAGGNRALQGYIGGLISTEYDLEGMGGEYGDFRDFFIKNDQTTETLASLHQASA